MTELDDLTQQEPEFESFSNWKTTNSTGDVVKDRLNWSNYVREEYVKANVYNEEIEKDILNTTIERLKEEKPDVDWSNSDNLASLFAPEDTSLDTKLKAIQSTFNYDTPEWDAASRYFAFKEAYPEGQEMDEATKQRGMELESYAATVADRYYDDAKRRKVLTGELPIARITNAEGRQEYIIGSSFDKENLADSIRNSADGGITFADTAGILATTRVPSGFKEEAYKVKRYTEARSVIENIWGGLSNSTLDKYADTLAEADREGREVTDVQKPDFASIRKEVNKTLPDNEGFTDQEIEKAFTQSAYARANGGGKFKIYEDPEELYKNIRNVGYETPLVNPSIMADENKLKAALDGNPQLTDDDRTRIMDSRIPFLQANFDHYNEKLSRFDETSEKWLNTLQAGRAAGKKDYEILGEYASNPENFSEMATRISGIAESVQDGFGELVAALPMMAKADWARDYMIGNIKERNDRREIARLFNTELGTGQDFMEAIAPMLVDVGATALLSLATAPAAGAGGAAFAAAKSGARLTAKGLVKSMASNAFRQLPNETLEQASKRLLAEGLIKQSTQEAGANGAMAAIKAYNSSLISKIGTTSAMALPAFNRSAGATYASVYNQFQEAKNLRDKLQKEGKWDSLSDVEKKRIENHANMTPEQMHDRALGAGLTSGAITAAITSSFGALGRGALEDALLGGASKKQIKNILTKITKIDDIKDEEFTQVVSKAFDSTLKKFGSTKFTKEAARNALDEGMEEGLDDFINSFVSDAATDENTPFLQRLESAGRSALIGAGMGAGVPAVKATKDLVMRQSNAEQRRLAEITFAQDISNRLAETSPISAQTVLSILKAPRSGRAAYAASKLAEARATVSPPQVPVVPEDGTTVKDEAGVGEPEPSLNVLTPRNLTNMGAEPEVVFVPEVVAPEEQAAATEPVAEEGPTIDVEAEVIQPEVPLLETQEEVAAEEPVEVERPVAETLPKADPERVKLIQDRLSNVTQEEVEQAIREEMVVVEDEGPQQIKPLPAPVSEVEVEIEPPIQAAAPVAAEKTLPAIQAEATSITTPEKTVEETDAPEDALAFTKEDEIRINTQAESLGVNKEEVMKHLVDTFNNIQIASGNMEPVVEKTAPKKAAKAPVAKATTAKAPVAKTKAPITEATTPPKIKWDVRGIGNTPRQIDVNYFGFTVPMLPSEFRKLVPEGVSDPDTKEYIKGKIQEGESIAPPYLNVTWNDERKVWVLNPKQHEGRSRTDAASEIEPDVAMPVSLLLLGTKRARHLTDEMRNAPIVFENNLNKIVFKQQPQAVQTETPKQKNAIEKAVSASRDEVVERLAQAGAPIRFMRGSRYGMPKGFDSDISESDLSDNLAKRVFELYKPLSTDEVSELYQIPISLFKTKQTKRTSWWNPFKQQFVESEKIKFHTVVDGGRITGLFDNNPFTVAAALKSKMPIYIPNTFSGNINKAIKYDKQTGVIYDVRFPDPRNPLSELSIVNDKESTKPVSDVAETISKQFVFTDGIKPPLDSTLDVHRDLENLGEQSPKEGSPTTTYYKAIDSFNRFINAVYPQVTGSPVAKKAIGQSNALLKLFGFGDKKKGLTPAQTRTANETAIMELVPEFYLTLFRGELYQTLQNNNAIVSDATKEKNKYSIDPASVAKARSILLERIKVPEDFKLPEYIKDKSTQEAQAYFLLTSGFKTGQTLPKIDGVTMRGEDINADSSNVIIDQFIFNSINDDTSRPDKNGLFPNVGAVVKRVSERVMGRLKYEKETASKNDFYDAAIQFEGDVSDVSRLELDAALEEIYGSSNPYDIHSSLDSLKAEKVFRNVRKEVEQLLRTDADIAKSIRRLAKRTVYANEPELADNKFPVDVFRDIAQWASPSTNKQTAAESFTFRRQLLDHFPVANVTSALVHDAFEASGAFAYDFTRVADANTVSILVRNGLTEKEAKFVLEKRNLKRIMEETGVTEQEAASILESQRKVQFRYSAPSFIRSKYREFYRRLNQKEINRLGLESGNSQSVYDALRQISTKGLSKENRAVAKLLLRFQSTILNTRFLITDIKNNKAGDFSRGVDGTNMVYLNKSGFYGVGVESVLLHEYIHAITVDVLNRPNASLTPAQRSAKTRLNGLMQLAMKQYNSELQKTGVGSLEFEAATVNIEEFVATFFSSPSFQSKLKLLQQEEIKSRSFFARIYDAILDFFGIKPKTDIDKAFAALVDLSTLGNIDDQYSIESQVDRSLVETRNNGASRRIVPVKSSDAEVRMTSFEPIDSNIDSTPEQEAGINQLIDQAISSLVPDNVEVTVFETQEEADRNGIFKDRPEAAVVAALMQDSEGRSVSAIFVNRSKMREALLSRSSNIENPLMAKAMMESIFNEELFHVAEFYAFTTEEITELANTMSDVEFDDIIDDYTSVPARRDQLKLALRRDDNAEIKNQLIGEMLRMRAQKITRGFTTEEDIAFYESNPSLMRIAFRYMRGFFRRMYARYNINKNNPELAAAIHRMSTELRFLQEGTYNPDTHSAFDPNNPDANFEIIRQRFTATAAEITADTTDEEIERRFKGLFDSLELPVSLFSAGEYKHMSTRLEKLFKGDIDPRIQTLFKSQKFFEQATDKLGKSMMVKINKLITETYGKGGIDPSVLSDATGTTEFIKIDKKLKQSFQEDYRNAKAARTEAVARGEIDKKWISTDALAAMRKAMIKDRIDAETDKARQEIRARQARAIERISKDSPQLAAALVEMRKVTDLMSKKVKEKYNLSESMQVKFDANMGIYLTRAYKAFNEEGYIERVLESNDPKFVEIRQEASVYFRDRYIKQLANKKLRVSKNNAKITGTAPITKEKAIELATDEVNNDPAIISQFMAQFLRSYSPDYIGRVGTLPKGVTKSLIDNLRRKSDLDPSVRKLLGEYDQETEGLNNLLRTYSVVSTMVARQSFYNNLIDMAKLRPVIGPDGNPVLDENGEPVQDGFLLTEDDLRERIKKNPMMQQEYVNIRTGKLYTPDTEEKVPQGLAGQYDPTYNYYGPKEMVDGMRRMYTPPVIDENLTGAQQAVNTVVTTFNSLTGLSLGVKTLGSIPFYFRNIIGNMAFFAPSQGVSFNTYGKMLKNLKYVGEKFMRPDEINEYQAELISLGVLNNELNANLVKDMLSNKFNMERINEEIHTISGKIKMAAAKGEEFIKPLTSRLSELSQAVDGFYKMAYFENEVSTLTKAKEADIREGRTDSFYAKLSDYEIKYEAARKVKATAQSYSEAPPIVRESVRTVGMFIAPFLRFKTEVPRIIYNTYTEALAEIRSGNPVMVSRGWKRFTGMTSILGVLSAAVPTAIQMAMGIGEDEDEVLRSTVPEYSRDNTFFYYPWDGKLRSMDFTFLNPFASVIDPFLRAGENIFRGNPVDAMVSFTNAFMSQYLDMQIFSGAVLDTVYNKDSSTGQPIYYDSDKLNIFGKSLEYILLKVYTPPTLEKAYRAITSARGVAVDPQYEPLAIALDAIKPIKSYPVELKDRAERFLKDKMSERSDFDSRKNIAKSKRGIPDSQIREAAREFVESRVRIEGEIYKGLRGLSGVKGFGMTEKELVSLMRSSDIKMGPRRIMLLQNKMIEKPVLSPKFIEDMLQLEEGGEGIRRLNIMQDEINRLFPSRFAPLNL